MTGGGSVVDLEYLAGLRRRDVRDSRGVAWVEGVRFVACAADLGVDVAAVVTCRPLLRSAVGQMIARRLARAGVPRLRVTAEQFGALSILDTPQGIGAVVRQSWSSLPASRATGGALWIGFDEVRAPGNLGTVVRTACAAGAAGIVFLGDRADPFDPRAVRPTMGAIFRLRLVRASPDELARWKRATGCRVIGASAEARRDFRAQRYTGPTLLMLGSERRGLSPAQRSLCDAVVRIPMRSGIDSLNVAAAASVLLYTAFDQRHPRRRR